MLYFVSEMELKTVAKGKKQFPAPSRQQNK